LNRLHEPQLLRQTVVVIGGGAGIGLEAARRAREEQPLAFAEEFRASFRSLR
jgi:NAD(P)-dependent dehydrogenase (short-subunit alcohol dehydrogenase family)